MTTKSQSLQHTEAQERRRLLAVTSYDVRLDLASDDATFGSVTTVRFTSEGGPTFLDLKPVSVSSITLDGHPVDRDLLDRGRLPLDTTPGEHELVVDATMRFRNDGEGLHRSVDPADGTANVPGNRRVTATFSEAIDPASVGATGFTLTGAELQAAFEAALGRPLRRASFPWPLLRLATPFSPMLRALFEMRYLWQRPHRLDDGRLRVLLGEVPQTPLAEVVRQCLAGLSGPAPAVVATRMPAVKT